MSAALRRAFGTGKYLSRPAFASFAHGLRYRLPAGTPFAERLALSYLISCGIEPFWLCE